MHRLPTVTTGTRSRRHVLLFGVLTCPVTRTSARPTLAGCTGCGADPVMAVAA